MIWNIINLSRMWWFFKDIINPIFPTERDSNKIKLRLQNTNFRNNKFKDLGDSSIRGENEMVIPEREEFDTEIKNLYFFFPFSKRPTFLFQDIP